MYPDIILTHKCILTLYSRTAHNMATPDQIKRFRQRKNNMSSQWAASYPNMENTTSTFAKDIKRRMIRKRIAPVDMISN